MRAFKQKNCYDAKASDTVSKRSKKAFLKGAGILCACVFAGAAGACKKDDSVKEGKIYDFYGTAEFVLPFENGRSEFRYRFNHGADDGKDEICRVWCGIVRFRRRETNVDHAETRRL